MNRHSKDSTQQKKTKNTGTNSPNSKRRNSQPKKKKSVGGKRSKTSPKSPNRKKKICKTGEKFACVRARDNEITSPFFCNVSDYHNRRCVPQQNLDIWKDNHLLQHNFCKVTRGPNEIYIEQKCPQTRFKNFLYEDILRTSSQRNEWMKYNSNDENKCVDSQLYCFNPFDHRIVPADVNNRCSSDRIKFCYRP